MWNEKALTNQQKHYFHEKVYFAVDYQSEAEVSHILEDGRFSSLWVRHFSNGETFSKALESWIP